MKLRKTTRKIISRLEEISGYSVQVVEDKNLPASQGIAFEQFPVYTPLPIDELSPKAKISNGSEEIF